MNTWNPPPEFGRGGDAPPVRSAASHLDYQYLLVPHSRRRKAYESLTIQFLADRRIVYKDDALRPAWQWLKGNDDWRRLAGGDIRKRRNELLLIEIERQQYWQREEQVRQLSPLAKSTVTKKMSVGISQTELAELTRSLNLDVKMASLPGVTAEVGQKIGQSVTMTNQRENIEELVLENTKEDHYRRFALWHQVLTVYLRVIEPRRSYIDVKIEERSRTQYIPDGGWTITFADVPIR